MTIWKDINEENVSEQQDYKKAISRDRKEDRENIWEKYYVADDMPKEAFDKILWKIQSAQQGTIYQLSQSGKTISRNQLLRKHKDFLQNSL